MGRKYKRLQAATQARGAGNEKKTTVTEATGPTGAMYKQGTTKDVANFNGRDGGGKQVHHRQQQAQPRGRRGGLVPHDERVHEGVLELHEGRAAVDG